MKKRFGLFGVLLAACAVFAGELALPEFTEATSWRVNSAAPKEPIAAEGVLTVTGPAKTYTKVVASYPLGGEEGMNTRYTGIAFKVKGDGSNEWGCLTIEAGPRDGATVYFPLKSTEVIEYRVAFGDMAPWGDNHKMPAQYYAARDITGYCVGDRWKIGQNNYPRPAFSYEISDVRLVDDIQPKFTPGKHRPAPMAGVIEKLQAKKPVTILCFGDSITAGTALKDREKDRYATVLQALLREHYGYEDITVRSVAVGGAHTYHSIGWLDRDLDGAQPDAATMLIGYNNRSGKQSAQAYAEQLKRWMELFAMKTGGKASVALIPSVQGYPRFFSQQDMADATYVIGKEYGLPVPQLDKEIAKIGPVKYRKEYLADGIHPNPEGHKIFAEVLLKCFCK